MKYRQRTFYTNKQKSEMWDRWQRGESLSSIGRRFNRASSSIHSLLARTGGIRPPKRIRSRLALTLIEREEISRGLIANLSLREIARNLGRAASTVSREVGRNGGVIQYRATTSDAAAWDRAHRPKPCKLLGNDYLCRTISAKLTRKWSPQQIAGWLMRKHPDVEDKRISHETIYRSLFIQTRGVLKKELQAHLRATRSIRRSRHATMKRSGICEPHSPWQRGSNENTNRLLRQYFPKGTNLSIHSQAKLSAVARQLNERPRKTLQYQTPAERFAQCVASIS
jgi:IS30 family transposase